MMKFSPSQGSGCVRVLPHEFEPDTSLIGMPHLDFLYIRMCLKTVYMHTSHDALFLAM